MAETINKTARLEARITPNLRALLKRAAEIEGRSVTDFVVSAVQEAAERRIEQAHVMRLSLEDQRAFVEAILDPPEPTPALKRASGAIGNSFKTLNDRRIQGRGARRASRQNGFLQRCARA